MFEKWLFVSIFNRFSFVEKPYLLLLFRTLNLDVVCDLFDLVVKFSSCD